MTIEQIKAQLKNQEYDFLRNNEHLGKNIILLGLGGSYAYGTNWDDGSSDIDVRGAALNQKKDILLKRDFDQIVDDKTDTTIYSFEKLISLLTNMNPNTCEIVGLKPEHYLYISSIGQELLDNVDMFLSKRCVKSFIQYELQQVYRLKQATAGLKDQSELEQHILNTMNNMMLHFGERYTPFPEDSINLYIDKSEQPDYDTEIFMDLHITHYPLRDWRGMWSEMNSTVKSYNKIGKRNKHAIEKGKLGKHMYNTIRLPLMCCDILEKKQIITFREKEHDLLMSMKRNEWLDERGMPIKEFFKLTDELNDKVEEIAKRSDLPEQPDYERIDKFVAKVNERIVRGDL